MDYVNPMELVQEALRVAKKKAALSAQDLLLRGFLAGAFLAYATSLVMVVLSQGLPPIVGALLFPVGFVILVLLGLELATGNFALLPAALAAVLMVLCKLTSDLCRQSSGHCDCDHFILVAVFLLIAIFSC